MRTTELVEFVQERFTALAKPRKAKEMAAYMRTDMPFYGVPTPEREPVYRAIRERFPIDSRSDYVAAVEALWKLPHREEKYAALHVAMNHPRFITPANLPLYRRLIIDGAWWDFVDGIGIRLVGRLVNDHRATVGPKMNRWIDDSNLWIRRCALICHIAHKNQTDERQLFDFCARRAREKEFFIRKAIGWSLREYAKTAPRAVAGFLRKHRHALSGLSFREAAKHLEIK